MRIRSPPERSEGGPSPLTTVALVPEGPPRHQRGGPFPFPVWRCGHSCPFEETPIPTTILYGNAQTATGEFENLVFSLIEKNNAGRVCDIGGGANPLLSEEYIRQKNISYHILDISKEELEKAPQSYRKIVCDIASRDFSLDVPPFDLVFSRMLAEHVKDGRMFHTNVRQMLARGGVAVHFFPTLYALPFLVNWLTPEALADSIANVLTPRDKYQHAKFPAYYSWCRGPIDGQLRRLANLGFDIIEYKGFFGHPGYYRKVAFLKRLHEIKTNYLLKRPNPLFTSYAYVVLKKR